jgi:hypothetical protein
VAKDDRDDPSKGEVKDLFGGRVSPKFAHRVPLDSTLSIEERKRAALETLRAIENGTFIGAPPMNKEDFEKDEPKRSLNIKDLFGGQVSPEKVEWKAKQERDSTTGRAKQLQDIHNCNQLLGVVLKEIDTFANPSSAARTRAVTHLQMPKTKKLLALVSLQINRYTNEDNTTVQEKLVQLINMRDALYSQAKAILTDDFKDWAKDIKSQERYVKQPFGQEGNTLSTIPDGMWFHPDKSGKPTSNFMDAALAVSRLSAASLVVDDWTEDVTLSIGNRCITIVTMLSLSLRAKSTIILGLWLRIKTWTGAFQLF